MAEEYTMSLALVDIIPNILFIISIIILMTVFRKLLPQQKKIHTIWLLGGILAFLGGIQKAIWKVIMAINQESIDALSEYLFVYQTIGFGLMMAGTGMLLFTLNNPQKTTIKNLSILMLMMAPWKIPLLGLTILFAGVTYFLLARLAFTHKCKGGSFFFVGAFVLFLAMGGLAAGDLTIAKQWIAEITNIAAQILFLAGSIQFNKYGCEI